MKPAHHTAIALAAALLAAGCSKEYIDEEALSFGYKIEDAKSTNLVFLVASPGVTNWVPERVIDVYASYEWSKDELALVAAAQAVEPSGEIEKIPDGFAKDLSGAWLTFWEKKAECFGEKGVTGFIAHFDEDRNVWETGESYFSCYWDTEEEALAALARIEKAVASGFAPKKFHKFAGGWVAEYVRLCATCIVGRKADGRWSCMFDFRDKCRPGCGTWYAEEEQQTRYDNYRHAKALKAWREKTDGILKANHEDVAKPPTDVSCRCWSPPANAPARRRCGTRASPTRRRCSAARPPASPQPNARRTAANGAAATGTARSTTCAST